MHMAVLPYTVSLTKLCMHMVNLNKGLDDLTAIVANTLYRAIFTQVGVYTGIKSAACELM